MQRLSLVAAGLKFAGSDGAMIGRATLHQFMGDLGMAASPARLQDGRLVSAEAQPVQAVQNGVDGGLGGAFLVGVLDPQQELAACRACI